MAETNVDQPEFEAEGPVMPVSQWHRWLVENQRLAADITARRLGEPLNVESLWGEAHRDLETRGHCLFGH